MLRPIEPCWASFSSSPRASVVLVHRELGAALSFEGAPQGGAAFLDAGGRGLILLASDATGMGLEPENIPLLIGRPEFVSNDLFFHTPAGTANTSRVVGGEASLILATGGVAPAPASSRSIILFRGTTRYEAIETVENFAFDMERKLSRQRLGGFSVERQGLYLTTQRQTAEAFAELAGGRGRQGGAFVLQIEINEARLRAIMRKYGIRFEELIPRPLSPGQTETLIPPNAVREFERAIRAIK